MSEAALLAAIIESSEDAIVSKDLNGIVTSWNRAAERIFGYTADEMIGKPIRVIAAPDRIDEMPKILERIRSGERIEHYETRRMRKDGRIIDVALTVSPVLGGDGRIVGASKIARDISDRKETERALARHAELLARQNSDLRQFAYIISHDLQEPLRTINSFSQLLRQRYHGRLDHDADEFLDYITGAASRMSELIRGLLSYASVTNIEETEPAPLNTRECLDRALANLERAFAESRGIVEIGEMPDVNADATSMTQIFQNLVSNALKYRGPEPPRIRVGGQRNGRECIFSVSDNGIGIAPEYHDKIFGLFRRVHGPEYRGTGIGLALCKKLVERMGGRIWVESKEGEGSTFRFTARPA